MTRSSCVAAALLLLPTAAFAQSPPPADFMVIGYLDAAVPHRQSVVLQGWATECRSGLQPVTQRTGSLRVFFTSKDQPAYAPPTFTIDVYDRPDVAAVIAPICPAVGPAVGFAIAVPQPPGGGTWIVHLVMATKDGAGRPTKPLTLEQRVTLLPEKHQ